MRFFEVYRSIGWLRRRYELLVVSVVNFNPFAAARGLNNFVSFIFFFFFLFPSEFRRL